MADNRRKYSSFSYNYNDKQFNEKNKHVISFLQCMLNISNDKIDHDNSDSILISIDGMSQEAKKILKELNIKFGVNEEKQNILIKVDSVTQAINNLLFKNILKLEESENLSKLDGEWLGSKGNTTFPSQFCEIWSETKVTTAEKIKEKLMVLGFEDYQIQIRNDLDRKKNSDTIHSVKIIRIIIDGNTINLIANLCANAIKEAHMERLEAKKGSSNPSPS